VWQGDLWCVVSRIVVCGVQVCQFTMPTIPLLFLHPRTPSSIATTKHTQTQTNMHTYTGHTCIHIYAYTCTHTHICMYMHTYIHTHIRMYMHTYIHIYACTCTHKCIHIYACTCTHTYIHIYACTCIHTYIHICTCTCTHTYIHIYTHILHLCWVSLQPTFA